MPPERAPVKLFDGMGRYRLEWDDIDELRLMIGISRIMATFNDIYIAEHAFDVAKELYPERRMLMMEGARIMWRHPGD
ncbi:hypothetical protein [uncultured Aureimonas sp.]|uniref:hypothetical protein n=1 Tax=uncultured Aureimonas sp. TaxID=1604662 RepID=UPI002600816D|nr:hypothetical protein [uncultured Aureimonas sp.]